MTLLDLFANPVAAFLVDLVVKATVLLLLATGLAAMLRKSSAAVRHRVWSLTFAGLLLLPVLSYVMPELRLPILPAEMIQAPPAETAVEEIPAVEESTPETAIPQSEPDPLLTDQPADPLPPFDAGMSNELPPWELDPALAPPLETQPLEAQSLDAPAPAEVDEQETETVVAESASVPGELEEPLAAATPPSPNSGLLWLWIWGSGLSIVLLPVLLGLLQNRLLSGLSENVADASTLQLLGALRDRLSISRRVRLVESHHSRIPLTWGHFWPVILLPKEWRNWSTERKRLVLLHELAHVKRWDVAFQLLARTVCAVFWFHPLCWYALKRLKHESELACDDCVLMTGESPQQYASELVDIARSARRAIYPAAVAMAQTSSLEQRIRALLDRARSRLPLGGRLAAFLFAVSLLTVGGIAAITPVASEVAAETEAAVEDETPKVAVVEETIGEGSDDVVKASDEEAEADEDEDKLSTYRGTVVGPDGKPVAGASVKYLYSFAEYPKDKAWLGREGMMSSWQPTQLGFFDETTTDENGRYELVENWSQFERENEQRGTTRIQSSAMIVASVDARGAKPMTGWIRSVTNFQNPDDTSIRLQTANGQPIQGRLIDLEGRPLANARVSVELVAGTEPGEVDRWLSDVKRLTEKGALPVDPGERNYSQTESPETTAARFPANEAKVRGEMIGLQPVTTDDQGRFEFSNPGDDCLVMLRVESEGYTTVTVNVVTRAMRRVEARGALFNGLDTPYIESPQEFHGMNCTIVVPPSQPVIGVIRDADTNDPIPGIIVTANQGESISETDAEGRYRLNGLAPGSAERLSILTPESSPYFPREFITVPKQPGRTPIELDFDLRAGIWIEGRVVNRKTGKGQPIVSLHYTPYLDNPHAKRYQTFNPNVRSIITNDYRFMTDSEGRFRLRAIPGRGIVVAVSKQGVFRTGLGADSIAGLDESRDFASRLTYDDVSKKFCHSMAAVDIPHDVKTATLDLEIDPGGTVTLNVQDPDGKPLQGYKISGHQPSITKPYFPVSDSQVEIQGLSSKEQRPVLMLHEVRKLGRALEIDADDESGSEKSVKLQPLAKLTGRILDENGTPVDEAMVTIRVHNSYSDYAISLGQTFTDSNGRFEFNELLPGGDYRIFCHSEPNRLELIESIKPQPGETIDFGEVDITKEKAPEPKRTPATTAATDSKATAPNIITVRGRVLDPGGKPLAGATVRSAMPMYASLKPLFPPGFQLPMSETTSDADGQFEVSVRRHPFGDLSMYDQRWQNVWTKTEIAASHPDYGPAWVAYEEIADDDEFTLKLVPDVPIRGRVVDLEGRPVPDVDVSFAEYGAVSHGDLDAWIAGVKLGELPWTVWKHMPHTIQPRLIGIPNTYRTDAQGRFEIRRVGQDRVVDCNYQGVTVAYEGFKAAAREMEPIEKLINSPPNQATETVYGKAFTIVATLSRPVEGVVKDAESGKPLAGVDVHSYRFADYPYSNHRVLKTKTDASGRFRLTGFPKGDGNRLLVLPNDEQPYFMREVDVPNPTGADPVEMEIELHRGIWITGRVTDKQTGHPQHARLHYFPFRDNEYARALPEFDNNGNTDGDQMRYQTHPDGTYRLVGLPGRAIVGAESVLRQYRKGVGTDQIEGIREAGTFDTYSDAVLPGRLWPNNLAEINPDAEAKTIELNFQLEFGASVPVELVGPDGQPYEGKKITVRGHLNRSSWAEVDTSKFEVENLRSNETRTVLLHDEERHLGWVEQVAYDEKTDQPLTIRMQPDVTIGGRLVDGAGDPITGALLRLDLYPGGDFSISLSGDTTGKDGRFTLRVPAGADYDIFAERVRNASYTEIAEKLQVQPGETIDLGVIDATREERPEPKRTPAKKTETSNKRPASTTVTVRGQVLDPAGKPVEGARVVLANHPLQRQPVADIKSDRNGRFEFSFDDPHTRNIPQPPVEIAAVADGFGTAWYRGEIRADQELTLHLTVDAPVRGRILDLEGKPVPGVRVEVHAIGLTENDDAGPLIQSLKERQNGVPRSAATTPQTARVGTALASTIYPHVISDDDGRFVLKGLGRERYAELIVESPSIVSELLRVITRPDVPTMTVLKIEQRPEIGKETWYGGEFTYVAEPCRPVMGTVRDEESGRPLAGVRVAGTGRIALPARYAETTTDEQGRFRLTGLAKQDGQRIMAIPADGQLHPVISIGVPTGRGLEPVTVDLDLPRGVRIEGTVRDKVTGKPVPAFLSYFVFVDDPDFARVWQSDRYPVSRFCSARTDSSGKFSLIGFPGRGVVAAQTVDRSYMQGVGADEIDGLNRFGRFQTLPFNCTADNYNALAEVTPNEDLDAVQIDLVADPGETIEGRVVDADGNELSGTFIRGLTPNDWWNDEPLLTASFAVTALKPGETRKLLFLNDDSQLAGSLDVRIGDDEPVVARLAASGTILGRVVDADGVPVAGAELQSILSGKDEYIYTLPRNRMVTDRDGRFRISGLIPGAKYSFGILEHIDGNNYLRRVAEDIVMEPEETKDLGTLTLRADDDSGAETASEPKNARVVNTANEKRGSICAGQVVDEHGRPAAGANVAVIARSQRSRRGSDFSTSWEILAEGTTDRNGQFQLTLQGVSSRTHRAALLLARKDGVGMAWGEWGQLDLDTRRNNTTLNLRPEEPIRGRLIDIDGRPADGTNLLVWGITKPTDNRDFPEYVAAFFVDFDSKIPAAWIPQMTTDEQGRFTIRGIPAGFGAVINVAASERFAPQRIALNTGRNGYGDERDAYYPWPAKNVKSGEEAIVALSPAQTFEGVVRYADTGEPAPHARLNIHASRHEDIVSLHSVMGQADDAGRYRITPKPGIAFLISAYPPGGVPYLARETPNYRPILWKENSAKLQVDVELPRGVLIKGRVTEAGNKTPVARATVQYIPESDNNDNASDEIITGMKGAVLSDEDGNYSIAVLPGPGRLLVHRDDGNYVVPALSLQELNSGRPGGQRVYVHAVQKVNPRGDDEELSVDIELQPGKRLVGRLVDKDGQPIPEASLISRLGIPPGDRNWNGSDFPETRGGGFELNGLAEGEQYPIHFLDSERKLGATAVVNSEEVNPTVVLQTCGSAKMRFIDAGGRPVADYSPHVQIVLTPGVHRFDREAIRSGKQVADTVSIATIDLSNYPDGPMSDKNGELLLPVLIPGATYQLVLRRGPSNEAFIKTFKVQPGESLDLGDVLVNRQE